MAGDWEFEARNTMAGGYRRDDPARQPRFGRGVGFLPEVARCDEIVT